MLNPLLARAAAALLALAAPAFAGTILIDPGHGGKDPGGSAEQLKESDWALSFAKSLETELKAQGHVVILTRTEDQFLPLKDREALVHQAKADVVLGIHLSSSKNSSDHGIRIYRCPRAEVADLSPKETELAEQLGKAFSTGISAKPVVSSGHLGRAFLGSKGALLLELGYLSNAEDLKNIRSPEYQQELIKALSGAVTGVLAQ